MQITVPAEPTSPQPDLDPLDLDMCDPTRYRDGCQHDLWRTLREDAPAHLMEAPNGTEYWAFGRYAECERIIKDARTFSSEDGTIMASLGIGDAAGGQTITLMDPPEHGTIRRPTMKTLAHSAVRARAGRISEEVDKLVAPLLAGGEHDVAAVLRRLPMAVVGELMGIPESYWDLIAHYTTASIAPEDPFYASGDGVAQTLRHAHHELFACFAELIAAKRAEPSDDLLSALVALRPDGKGMEDWRIALNCYSFLLGANSTTPHVAAHTLWALADRPQIWDEVTADPSIVDTLIDEGARWTSPTHHLVRRSRVDIEIGGAEIAAGDWICTWVASANRDESMFPDPYTFDPRRRPNQHLSFGAGPHYCIGAPSSRFALSALFGALARSVDRIEVTGQPRHLVSNWINGLTSLPMTFHRGTS